MNARLMHSPIAFNGNQTILSSLSFFNIKKDLQFLHRNFSYRIATNVSKTSLQNSLKLRQVPSICVFEIFNFCHVRIVQCRYFWNKHSLFSHSIAHETRPICILNTGRNTQRLETRGKRKMSRTFRHRERNNEETRFVNSRFAVVAPRGVGRAMFLAFENQERVCG